MASPPRNKVENALIVTHYDLDGFVCALSLIEAFHLGVGRVLFLSYGSHRSSMIESAVQKTNAESVFVCDIGLADDDMDASWATDPRLYRVLFDHHRSTLDLNLDRFDEVYVDASGDVCSSDLVFEYLQRRLPAHLEEKLRQWTALAHDRDLWINRDREMGQRVSWLLKDRIHQRLETALTASAPAEFLKRLHGKWKRGEELFADAAACARNTAHLFEDGPVPVKIAYVKRDTSDVAEELQEGGQLIVLLNLFGRHIGVSLRADREDIDAAEIAQRCFGGGGHRSAAAGFLDTRLLLGGYRAVYEAILPILEEQLKSPESSK